MAGLLPSFQSGSNLQIYIGNVLVAYATSVSFSRDMSDTGIGGIGSYSYDAIEPLMYAARGTFSLTRYSNEAIAATKLAGGPADGLKPSRATESNLAASGVDGNSMLHPSQFNPTLLIVSKTFDIKVFERNSVNGTTGNLVQTLKDCRLTGYSMGFTPGSVISENLSFRCLRIIDNQ